MPSILEGFEYDIFISYRHNDNLDGWVTDFVQGLGKELKATVKEQLTIYFDKNPHDGLLETHNVDKSLEGKLKCIIFIPILSQTYCDPKSFAWQHEFCAFNKLANDDRLGRDVKLSHGNVSSRILPIQIHDLDAADKATIESEIGGPLRAIEFIFKSPGVNRPLTTFDKRDENSSKTFYRDQLNKVANAVKGIVKSVKGEETIRDVKTSALVGRPGDKIKKAFVMLSILLVALATGTYFYLQLNASPGLDASADRSIAVLAFVDMSPTRDQEYLGDGISEEIINTLAQTKGIKVIARSSSFQFKGKSEDVREIGKVLGVATVLEGSFIRIDNRIKVTAQLVNASDGSHIWSKKFNEDASNIFDLQDEIAAAVAESFNATHEKRVEQIWNEEAYKLYQRGTFFHNRGMKGDGDRARDDFLHSIKLDSTHAITWASLSHYYLYSTGDTAIRCINKALSLDSLNGEATNALALYYSVHLEFKKAEHEFRKLVRLQSTNPRVIRNMALMCVGLGYYQNGVEYAQQALIVDPLQLHSKKALGEVYVSIGDFNQAMNVFDEVRGFTDAESWIDSGFLAYLLGGNLEEAKKLYPHFVTSHEADSLFFALALAQRSGQQKKADDYLKKLKGVQQDVGNFTIAKACAYRQDRQQMYRYLEQAVKDREDALFHFMREPAFIPYRKDPEFKSLQEQLGFPSN